MFRRFLAAIFTTLLLSTPTLAAEYGPGGGGASGGGLAPCNAFGVSAGTCVQGGAAIQLPSFSNTYSGVSGPSNASIWIQQSANGTSSDLTQVPINAFKVNGDAIAAANADGFYIQYTGGAGSASITILNSSENGIGTLELDAPDGVPVYTVDLSTVATVATLVGLINGVADFSASIGIAAPTVAQTVGAGGIAYHVADTITLDDGCSTHEVVNVATINVTTGAVLTVTQNTRAVCTSGITNPKSQLSTSGSGTGVLINLNNGGGIVPAFLNNVSDVDVTSPTTVSYARGSMWGWYFEDRMTTGWGGNRYAMRVQATATAQAAGGQAFVIGFSPGASLVSATGGLAGNPSAAQPNLYRSTAAGTITSCQVFALALYANGCVGMEVDNLVDAAATSIARRVGIQITNQGIGGSLWATGPDAAFFMAFGGVPARNKPWRNAFLLQENEVNWSGCASQCWYIHSAISHDYVNALGPVPNTQGYGVDFENDVTYAAYRYGPFLVDPSGSIGVGQGYISPSGANLNIGATGYKAATVAVHSGGGGTGYKVNDLVYYEPPNGGIVGIIQITNINGSHAATAVAFYNNGAGAHAPIAYGSAPCTSACAVTHGAYRSTFTGSGLTLDFTWTSPGTVSINNQALTGTITQLGAGITQAPTVTSGGAGTNNVGDVLTLNDGCTGTVNGVVQAHAKLAVASVTGGPPGTVATVTVNTAGVCVTPPVNPVAVLSSTGSDTTSTYTVGNAKWGGTYTITQSRFKVCGVGGGGGAGGVSNVNAAGAGPGMGGSFACAKYVGQSVGGTISYNLGLPGPGGAAGNNNGTVGTATVFGTLSIPGGGKGVGSASGGAAANTSQAIDLLVPILAPTTGVEVQSARTSLSNAGSASAGMAGNSSPWGIGGTNPGTNANGNAPASGYGGGGSATTWITAGGSAGGYSGGNGAGGALVIDLDQ